MENISDILLSWFAREGRDLPWRRTRDPYRIWLSEVILQQTRVAQGLEYYLRFTERFPDIEHFGNADAVPQPPERCLSRKAGIMRCCLYFFARRRRMTS